MIKEYKVCAKNSTVCGYPGRDYDWSKFDWDAKTSYDFRGNKYTGGKYKGKNMGILIAPKVFKDNGSIAENCEYLHVPYAYKEQGTIYRVRPNESMYAGKVYRGHKIIKQTTIKKEDGWYWRLELKDEKEK